MTRYLKTVETLTRGRWCEWFGVRQRLWKMKCCDCGLVHDFQFHLIGRSIQVRARRNNRATAAVRRARPISKERP